MDQEKVRNIISWFGQMKDYYLRDYYFLGISDENWEKMFRSALRYISDDVLLSKRMIESYVNQQINDYIKRQIDAKKTRIITNILYILRREYKNYGDLLKAFLMKIKQCNMEITEEYFLLVKKDSDLLRKILKYFNLDDIPFNNLEVRLKEIIGYQNIKPSNKTLQETEDIFRKYLNLLTLNVKKDVKQAILVKNNYFINKIKFLISCEEEFLAIHKLYEEKIGQVAIGEFRKMLFLLSMDKLQYIIDEYHYNITFGNMELKRSDFLAFIAKQFSLTEEIKKQSREAALRAKKEEKEEVKEQYTRPKFLSSNKTIYDYFKDDKGFISEEDRLLIDNLFNKLSTERQEAILGYLKGDYSSNTDNGKQASRSIDLLKNQFKRAKMKKENPKTIYDYFKDREGFISEADKSLVDELVSNLPLDRQEGIKEYLKGEINTYQKRGKKASQDISLLKARFYRQKLSPKEDKSIYDYFRDYKDYISEADIQLVDQLFNSFPLERQEGILGYLKGENHVADEVGKRARLDITSLKKRFYRLKSGYEKTIYDYFKDDKGFISEEDKLLVDILFSRLNNKRQEGVLGYIEGRYHASDEIGIKGKRDIAYLQRLYSKYKINIKRIALLKEAQQIIELSFYKLGYTPKEFRLYNYNKIQEILQRGIKEEMHILSVFIVESYQFLKDKGQEVIL